MTLPNLISFSGYLGVGRNAAADLLVAKAKFVKTTITEPLEAALLHLDPYIVDPKEKSVERYSDMRKSWGDLAATEEFDEVRRLVRVLKTYFGPHVVGGEFWTGLVYEKIKALHSENKKVALSGVVNSEELVVVRELDGVAVWINRPIKARFGDNTITADDCDVIVENDGTYNNLYVSIVEAVEEFQANKEKTDNVG